MDVELKKEIRKIALQNAVEHDGQTSDKIVLSKILGTRPDLRSKVNEIIKETSTIVNQVNKISLTEQKLEIEKEFPEIISSKEKKVQREGLPPLEGAEQSDGRTSDDTRP